MKKILLIILAIVIQSNLSAQPYTVNDYNGTWEGSWFNTTFNSTGSMYMEISLNESDMTYSVYTDYGGNVFGGSDPDPSQDQGLYTNTAGVISFETVGPVLGPTTFNFDTNTGGINIEAVPGGTITQYLITGTATPQVWDLDFILTATWGGAVGTIDLTKTSSTTTFLDVESESNLRKTFSLKQNYPNPFNPNTKIYYSLPNEGYVSITIYDVLGKEINQLISQVKPQGSHSIEWNGTDNFRNPVSAGIYLYQMQTGDFIQTKKMVLMR